MGGRLVLVVGPSGAGKDTLLNAAKVALSHDGHFVFPRRVVTRPALAALEDHDSLSEAEFVRRESAGEFALSWTAHGLHYGVPASVRDDMAAGRVVVVNGSRHVAVAALERYPDTAILLVDAEIGVRARRLMGRGREDEAAISRRLAREVDVPLPGAIKIDNSGSIEASTEHFIAALISLAGG
jgi:ribose 1,5-bisphosphokinase